MSVEQIAKQVIETSRKNISSGEDTIIDMEAHEDALWQQHLMEQDAPHSMGELA